MFNCFGFFGSSVKILLVPPGKLSVIGNGKRDFDMLPLLEKWVKHETWESYKLFAVSKTCPMAWRPNHLQSEPLWYFLCQNWNKIQSCDILCRNWNKTQKCDVLCQNWNNIQNRNVLVRSDCWWMYPSARKANREKSHIFPTLLSYVHLMVNFFCICVYLMVNSLELDKYWSPPPMLSRGPLIPWHRQLCLYIQCM